uniref:G-protein coupled receptors family 1 profile domain-containing protein n=1 Tax=Xenopus tropicalis TaxID=8364 RepID=A0A803JJD8_XENTR
MSTETKGQKGAMHARNETTVTEFILVGFSVIPGLEYLFFTLFLIIYVTTVLGNTAIIFAYSLCSDLHTPMYLYLTNFSFFEICYVSITVPKLISDLLTERKTISFYAIMAYDRYNAICHPLLYQTIMNRKVCVQLLAGTWIISVINSLIHTLLTFSLPFCDNVINHFFCDIPPLLKLACKVNLMNEIALFAIAGFIIMGSCVFIVISYTQIIATILGIHSTSGRRKAFSTCSSHLTAVTIYYGSGAFMYLRPKPNQSLDQDRQIALMYTVIAPLIAVLA